MTAAVQPPLPPGAPGGPGGLRWWPPGYCCSSSEPSHFPEPGRGGG